MFRKSAVAASLIAIGGITAALPAAASALPYSVGNLANISVIDRSSGQTLPVYRYRGEYWVAGNPGAKYSVAVANRTGERVMAVMSVDGVNVLNGDNASVDQAGYVFSGHQRYEVSGWRKSDREVAAFQFVASPFSYAERTGRPENVGVIGVALFREKYQAPVWSPYSERQSPNDTYESDSYRYKRGEPSRKSEQPLPAPSASAAPSADAANGANATGSAGLAKRRGVSESEAAEARVAPKLGTGHGEREWSQVSRTEFERAQSTPNETIRIRYDSRENLISLGVIREPFYGQPRKPAPNPFPDSYGYRGYVPDPPRW
jgi:hypothetical protein